MSGHKTIEWYERQLETNTKLTPSQIKEYENEIERLADIEARAYNRAQEKKAEERKRFEELLDKNSALSSSKLKSESALKSLKQSSYLNLKMLQ